MCPVLHLQPQATTVWPVATIQTRRMIQITIWTALMRMTMAPTIQSIATAKESATGTWWLATMQTAKINGFTGNAQVSWQSRLATGSVGTALSCRRARSRKLSSGRCNVTIESDAMDFESPESHMFVLQIKPELSANKRPRSCLQKPTALPCSPTQFLDDIPLYAIVFRRL